MYDEQHTAKKPIDSSCLTRGTAKYHIIHFHSPTLKHG